MIDLTLKAFPGRAFCLFSEKWIEFFFFPINQKNSRLFST